MISATPFSSWDVLRPEQREPIHNPLLPMKETASGLVRYRGRRMSPAMARLLKASTHHTKSRKYAPRGTDPGIISPTLADVLRLGPAILSPASSALHERVAQLIEELRLKATQA